MRLASVSRVADAWRSHPWSLRTRLVLLVVVALFPMLLFSVVMLARHATLERQAIEHAMQETAGALVLAVDGEVAARRALLTGLATSRSLRGGDVEAFYLECLDALAGDGTSIVLADARGHERFDTMRPFGESLPDRANPDAVRRVVETREPLVSDMVRDPASGRPLVTVDVPVVIAGEVRYVLAMTIVPASLNTVLHRSGLAPDWLAAVVDRRGTIIARTANAEELVGTSATRDLLERLEHANDGSFPSVSRDGLSVYTAFRRSPVSGWTVAIGVPRARLDRPVWTSLGLLGAGGIALLVLGGWLAWLAGRPIAQSMALLGAAAREVGRGGLPTAVGGGVREVDDVGRELRAAAELVDARTRDRARAERERTKLLHSERRARMEAQTISEALHGLHSVLGHADPRLLLDGILRELLDRVRGALRGDSAIVLLVSERGHELVARASSGVGIEIEHDARVPIGQGVAGRIAADGQAVIIDDVSAVDVVSPFLRAEVASLVAAPLKIGERVIGVMHVGSRRPRTFTEHDLRLLQAIADSATVLIDHARLYQDEWRHRRAAEAANRAKDDFLAVLSHELRTPLTAILGWARLLRRGSVTPDRLASGLETIERNTWLQVRLVNDLLDMSRIIAGNILIERRATELRAIVAQALETVRHDADAKGVELRADLDAEGAQVFVDASRMGQVVTNLVTNAVKFTPPGGRVDIGLTRYLDRVRLTVADTGEGIARDFLPHVFDAFRQADPSMRRSHGGLGLGLAIVRHLVEMHGGTVRADSPGQWQGSVFTVELPVIAVHVGPTRERPLKDAAGAAFDAECEPRLDGLRLLVVDDHADTRETLHMLLADCGADVTLASSAPDALAVLRRVRFDLVLTDLEMPDVDGYALLEQIRARGNGSGTVPVVAITAHVSADDRARVLASGFAAHLAKPMTANELAAAVRAALERARRPEDEPD